MKLKKYSWRNFGPFGNVEQTIEFPHDYSLTLIKAPNGYGKSTLRNIIEYGLYGKVRNIPLKDLVNRVNKKNMIVECDVTRSNHQIEIKRGYKASKKEFRSGTNFDLLIDGQSNDQAGMITKKKLLEEEIFNMPYHLFTNIISLSVNDFKSFLTLSNLEKRKIIDPVFSIDVVNQISDILKERRKSINKEFNELEYLIKNKEKEILNNKFQLENQSNTPQIDNTENLKKLKKIKTALSKCQDLINKHNIEHKTFTKKINEANLITNQKEKLLNILESNKNCPVCQSSLDDDNVISLKDTLSQEIENLISKNKTLLEKNEKAFNEMQKFQEIFAKLNKQQYELNYQIKNATYNVSDKTEQLLYIINEYELALEELLSKFELIQKEIEYYEFALNVFSETGVKEVLVKNVIEPLNKLIKNNSRKLNYKFLLKFDTNFDVELKALGNVINPKTLSVGETKKADLIILLSWIELIKLRFPDLNIMFLDEIFSSLDDDNIFQILTRLKQITRKYNLNILVVTHANVNKEFFDRKIKITQKNGFSRVKVIENN